MNSRGEQLEKHEIIKARMIEQLNEEDKLNDFSLYNWVLRDYERCSINVISWLGSEFKKFNGDVGVDEEHELQRTTSVG